MSFIVGLCKTAAIATLLVGVYSGAEAGGEAMEMDAANHTATFNQDLAKGYLDDAKGFTQAARETWADPQARTYFISRSASRIALAEGHIADLNTAIGRSSESETAMWGHFTDTVIMLAMTGAALGAARAASD